MVSNLNLMESRRRILNTPHLESLSGSALSFKTDMASKLKECRVHFTPVQEGTGEPSPDNVRPIVGWDGVTVTRCGKNIAPPLSDTDFWSINGYFYRSGNVTVNSSYKMCDYKHVVPGATYCTSQSGAAAWNGVGFYDKDYVALSFSEKIGAISLIAPDNAVYYRVYVSAYITNFQLELSSEATDYEPYTAQSLTIPFPQTIYGGYVDLVKGEVVEEIIGYNADDVGFKIGNPDEYNGEYGQRFQNTLTTTFSDDTNGVSICNIFPCVKQTNSSINAKSVTWLSVFRTGGNNIIYGCLNKNYLNGDNSIENIKTFLRTNGFLCTVKLATPTTYPLDPVTIRTLRGLNNIWSDANGNIEIKYWTH